MILLMGNCGAFRVAPALRQLTGAEVKVLGWTQVDAALRLDPTLVYVDLFGFDVIAPICVAAIAGRPIPRFDLDPLRAVVAALSETPVVYRGVRRPSAGAFGLLGGDAEIDAAFDELASVIRGHRVLDVQGLWARHGIPMDDVLGGLGHGEALGAGAGKEAGPNAVAEAVFHEAQWIASLWAARALPPIECVVVDLDLLIRGDLLADDFHARNPAWLPPDRAPAATVLEAWWSMERGLHEALRIVARRGVALALTTRNDRDATLRRFRKRAPVADGDPGPFAWMYEGIPEQVRSSIFSAHPALVDGLALDVADFAAVEADPRRPASEACRRVAERLGLELHALAFLGATEADREEVRANAPEITVPEGPAHRYRELLLHGPRLVRWESPAPRPASIAGSPPAVAPAGSGAAAERVEAFLRGLNIVVDVRAATPAEYPRVEELLVLCTEMNLTGDRPELDTLDAIYVGRCRASTSDYGIVAAGLVKDGRLVNWVCSCQVLPYRVAGTLLHLTLQTTPGMETEFVDVGSNAAALDVIREARSGCASWVSVGACA
ncbi:MULTISPECIES: hypothetical protein [Sorangium]|uniref:Uncharacterized protein n=1 Tax=Sorangium cellulosum (strain So ce56) TaxID=448385 RepID=A9FN45_SORC5|nr:hypothetical protein [Sorangium cellulosum]CAN98390.1 hypothetical protein sce8220 [Sorangium cellulosum So ce56]